MSKLSIAAGIALALTAGSALAADLPSRKGPPPAYVPPPSFSWNGLYGGINIGYGFGNGDSVTGSQLWRTGTVAGVVVGGPSWNLPNDLSGVTGGGQIGYNYQITPLFVVGVEADIQAADIRSSASGFSAIPGLGGAVADFGSVNTSKNVDWWGTVRGRLGVTLPGWTNFLVYGTGGFAYGQVVDAHSYSAIVTPPPAGIVPGVTAGRGTFDQTSTGWTAGGGVEWSPSAFPAWSVKVEYLYVDLGRSNTSAFGIGTPAGFAASSVSSSETRFHTVRAGLNWHFNPFASAPVLAKF